MSGRTVEDGGESLLLASLLLFYLLEVGSWAKRSWMFG